jgi:succinate-semialdehyde dehydrogenase / glutarate-semialdehyde dehydrogenase
MTIASINPATGKVLKTFEPLSCIQLQAKLTLAASTFESFRKTSFADRARWMNNAADILDAEKESFGKIMAQEMGKTYRSAVEEAAKSATGCRYYAANAERFMADEIIETSASRSYVRYEPLGPILAIMPWNFPFWQVFRFVGPALMAGNIGLLKHAANVPQCALAIEDILYRAGFPEGVFQNLLVEIKDVDSILDDARVQAATLTGSERAGIEVGIGAAKRIKKVVLELGGSDAFIVMPSAKLDDAVSTAVKARVINNGQSCIAAKRFIVAAEIYDQFERDFVEKMQSLKVGDPFDEKTDIGPLVSPEAVKSLHAQVQRSVECGAKLLTGGNPIQGIGAFYPPTVLSDVPLDSPAGCEELFGPVASLFRVKSAEEAVKLANHHRYGLGASAWTNDDRERDLFIDEIQAGMVFINQMVASDPRVPFGGVKRSGHGRELSSNGLREFTNIKTVWIR